LSSVPQERFASSTILIRDRYWIRRQCPVRAWIRIEAWSEEKAPYRRSVCCPGRAWSSFYTNWPGRPSESKRVRSPFRSFSTRRTTPTASRILLGSGAVNAPWSFEGILRKLLLEGFLYVVERCCSRGDLRSQDTAGRCPPDRFLEDN
jgi:hypothetical protein